MKKTSNKLLALLLALVMALSCVTPVLAADAKTVDEVRAEIQALSADARDYTAADRERVEAIQADFNALSAEDQAVLDAECSHDGTGQPLGRVLESALWTVWSFDPADNSTTLPDGTYDESSDPALSSEYSKGKSTSSRQKPWSVKDVTVENGKATATIMVESGSYTGIMLHGTTYEKTGGTSKTCEFAGVPIDLNSTFYFNGVSSSMATPIAFSITTTIEESAAPAGPERIDLAITNNTGMFKAATAYLETKDGKTTLVMALSGTGYHELYRGTYEEAVANGDGTADKGNDSWIHGYTNAEGKWEFRIPVADDDTYMPVVAVSNSYYNKYLNGQNALARAFYPRQMTLDREAKTLVTGDYEYSRELKVTNNVKMFKVPGATLDTVGGPNSNGYKASLMLTMGSDSFDKAFIGRADQVGEDTIAIDENRTFELPVKWVEEFGNPETLVNLLEEPFIVSFHSVKNDAWYERLFTVSEKDGTLVIDEAPAEEEEVTYTFVTGGDGKWTKGSGKDFELVVKRSVDDDTTFGRFTGITVDGKALDKADYTAVAGSVKITVKSAYLETLSAGEHKVAVTFDDASAETTLTVENASDGESPKTGDAGVMLWAAMAAASAAGFVTLKRRKDGEAA